MAEIVWTGPAIEDLNRIADYIALDNPAAASQLVQRIFHTASLLKDFPDAGSHPPEIRGKRYRQIVEPPCRLFYRRSDNTIYILHVMRSEQLLKRSRLKMPK